MVTTLFCIPGLLLESNWTLISPEPPTGIGCLGHCGTVQPQAAVAFDIIRGASPVFVNLNTWLTISPSLISPKLCSIIYAHLLNTNIINQIINIVI